MHRPRTAVWSERTLVCLGPPFVVWLIAVACGPIERGYVKRAASVAFHPIAGHMFGPWSVSAVAAFVLGVWAYFVLRRSLSGASSRLPEWLFAFAACLSPWAVLLSAQYIRPQYPWASPLLPALAPAGVAVMLSGLAYVAGRRTQRLAAAP